MGIRDQTSQLGLVLCTVIQRRVQWDFLLANVGDFVLGATPRCLGTGSKDGGLFQRELKSAEHDGMDGVGFENCCDGNAVSRPVACTNAFDGKVYAFLVDRA